MAGTSDNKIKLLYLFDIFYIYTDSEHILSAAQLCEKLALYGVVAERKSVYSDIEVLRRFGMDIVTSTSPRGFYLGTRLISAEHMRLIIDAIKYAPFIPSAAREQLFHRAQILVGPSAHKIIHEHVAFPRGDGDCREAARILLMILAAIREGKQISFEYSVFYPRLARVKKRTVTAEPAALACVEGSYRLLCREVGRGLHAYFAERMYGTRVIAAHSRTPGELLTEAGFSSVEQCVNSLFNIAERTTVELVAAEDGAQEIFDRFGSRAEYFAEENGETLARLEVRADEELVGWLMSRGKKITVRAPESLRREIVKKAKELLGSESG